MKGKPATVEPDLLYPNKIRLRIRRSFTGHARRSHWGACGAAFFYVYSYLSQARCFPGIYRFEN